MNIVECCQYVRYLCCSSLNYATSGYDKTMTIIVPKTYYSRTAKTSLATAFLLALTACGGSSGDAATDSTAMVPVAPTTTAPNAPSGQSLRGTTSSDQQFATAEILARAQSGEMTTATIDDQGRYTFDNLSGTGPWILRADLGNGNFMYSIAADLQLSNIVQNIHSYTDAIARNWYATQGLDIELLFNSAGAINNTPTTAELFAIQNGLAAVVNDVQAAYNLQNTNLSTIEYLANGSGVDAYLTQNPILQDGDSFTIVIFDPSTDTQSVAANEIDLSTDFSAADTIAPAAPQRVRALPSATDEITLVWDVASDNVGIARYAIMRDGQEIDTSPYPVFVDGGLAGGTDFTYTIVAIDGAGNESAESTAVSSETLAELDTTPPSAPGALSISARTGALDIGWTQTGINDVASFAIRRGLTETMLMDVGNVTSTFYIDSAVDAGVEYCYDVRAVDGSGNLSTPTSVSCQTAAGTVVTTTQPLPPAAETPVTVAPPANTNLTAPLVDVTNLVCTEEAPQAVFESTTISAGCYTALRGIRVFEPANLTLQPGVVIKFGSGEDFDIDNGASLTAEGTVTNPIVLSGLEPSPGFWNGVHFSFSNSLNNIFDHVQLEYAGGTVNRPGALSLSSSVGTPARVSISNSTFRRNDGPAMTIPDGASLSTLDGNRYIDNEISIQVSAESVALLDTRSSYIGNQVDAIDVTESTVNSEITWPRFNIPYHVDDLDITNFFTVDAGATLLFQEGASMRIRDEGVVQMIGTMEQPILLSSISGLPGAWQGVSFTFSQIENKFTYVTIDGASPERSAHPGALASNSGNNSPTRIALNNVTIQNSTDFAISAAQGTFFTDFTNVTLSGNAKVARVPFAVADVFNNAGSYTGNTENIVEVIDRSLEQPLTLSNADLAYSIEDISVNDSLTLEAGVTLEMQAGANFRISGEGSLTANGTAAAPISIIGERRLPGFWNGLQFAFSASPLNQLNYVLLADGGDGAGGIDEAANARFNCTTSSPSRLTITNSRIENSAGFGLHLSDTGCVVNVDANTTFTGNANGATN